MRKYLILNILLLIFVAILAVPAMAQVNPTISPYQTPDFGLGSLNQYATNLNNQMNQLRTQASRSALQNQLELANIIKRSDQMISKRVNDINALMNRIQNDSRLGTDDKTNLTAQSQNQISGLTTLKSKIDADTNLQDARNDSKQIITNFRVYELFLPQTSMLITIDNLSTTAANLGNLLTIVQNLVNQLNSQGKDLSSVQNLINDISSQLQQINSTLSADKTTLQSLNTTTPNYQTSLIQTKQDLTKLKGNFGQIRSDIEQMRSAFQSSLGFKPVGQQQSFNSASSSAH